MQVEESTSGEEESSEDEKPSQNLLQRMFKPRKHKLRQQLEIKSRKKVSLRRKVKRETEIPKAD